MSTTHKMPPVPRHPQAEGCNSWTASEEGVIRAYGQACWAAAMEAAAVACIGFGIRAYTAMQDDAARECARAIRAMASPAKAVASGEGKLAGKEPGNAS